MKILVIKFGVKAIETAARISDYIVAVCDPDLNGRVLAQHELPNAKIYTDTSLAIRDSGCDTILLTISDHAAQLALLAIAYGKDVLLAEDVSFGDNADRIRTIAAKAGRIALL